MLNDLHVYRKAGTHTYNIYNIITEYTTFTTLNASLRRKLCGICRSRRNCIIHIVYNYSRNE